MTVVNNSMVFFYPFPLQSIREAFRKKNLAYGIH
jgi:hypothetical protein